MTANNWVSTERDVAVEKYSLFKDQGISTLGIDLKVSDFFKKIFIEVTFQI